GFDEAYRNSYEDIDLCLRARLRRLRVVYCPRSVLYHFESSSEGRHANDDANVARFFACWGNTIEVDEPAWYRVDGFTSVPRIPARTLSQAVTQMGYERRRAETLTRSLVALEQVIAGPTNGKIAQVSASTD